MCGLVQLRRDEIKWLWNFFYCISDSDWLFDFFCTGWLYCIKMFTIHSFLMSTMLPFLPSCFVSFVAGVAVTRTQNEETIKCGLWTSWKGSYATFLCKKEASVKDACCWLGRRKLSHIQLTLLPPRNTTFQSPFSPIIRNLGFLFKN